MDIEAMRRAGYATVDALVARLADPEADPVLRRAGATEMRSLLGAPPPEQPTEYGAVLDRVLADVLPYAARTDHPGYLAFIPSFTTWPSALAELTAAAANLYCGAWMESAGAAQVELEVIDWFRGWLGMPAATAGLLVSGGSAANLSALLVAREAAGGPSPESVMYVSDQAPAGHVPFALCASAGSTNTGAVDPLDELADVCAAEGLWLHVDAAYGGFAALTAQGRAVLAGIDRADSVTLDPHKWLYQPMECGCVLIRDGARLERTFAIHPDYLDGDATHGAGEVNFADRGLQLSRSFRALKVWVAVHTFGLAAFRAAIQRNLELAEYAETLIRGHPELTLMAPATLGIVCFRREWTGCDEAETERRGTALAEDLERGGTALVSGTRLAGRHAIRLCILNPTTSEEHVRRVVEYFAGAPVPLAAADNDALRTVPLLAGVPGSTLQAVQARGVWVDVAGGEEVTRRWDSDRFFYIVLSGRYEVFIDARLIRTLGPGDHFGELAARDWGGGYGYARLATVRCAEPGRLLKLTSEDFQWLTDTEPTIKAKLAATMAERLRQR
jgi:aromatic-L-amino-acid/L-tryptophan decarboxylase